MGLRCIMGHDYGDPERTEERQENGDERVVTVREYRECRRCGHRKTISENTEVRTSETPGAIGAGETESAPGSGGETAHPSMGRGGTADAAAGETAAPDVTPGVDAAEATSGAVTDAGGPGDGDEEAVSAAEDDGVILSDDTTDADRDHGEWPGADAERPSDEDGSDPESNTDDAEHGGWPTPESDDEGYDAEPPSEGDVDGVDFGGGLAPGRSAEAPASGATTSGGETVGGGTGDGTSGHVETGDESAATSGITRAESDPPARTRPPTPDSVLSCPRCEYVAPSQASSLRPGDICPECSKGYLTEREE